MPTVSFFLSHPPPLALLRNSPPVSLFMSQSATQRPVLAPSCPPFPRPCWPRWLAPSNVSFNCRPCSLIIAVAQRGAIGQRWAPP